MRYNLIVANIKTSEIVVDLWYDDFAELEQSYEIIEKGLCAGYYMHIVNEKNDLYIETKKTLIGGKNND